MKWEQLGSAPERTGEDNHEFRELSDCHLVTCIAHNIASHENVANKHCLRVQHLYGSDRHKVPSGFGKRQIYNLFSRVSAKAMP